METQAVCKIAQYLLYCNVYSIYYLSAILFKFLNSVCVNVSTIKCLQNFHYGQKTVALMVCTLLSADNPTI